MSQFHPFDHDYKPSLFDAGPQQGCTHCDKIQKEREGMDIQAEKKKDELASLNEPETNAGSQPRRSAVQSVLGDKAACEAFDLANQPPSF